MGHSEAGDAALAALIRRVALARGAILLEVRAICIVPKVSDSIVRLVDVTDELRELGVWRITEAADITEAIRLLKKTDPYLAGYVFQDMGAVWTLVDDATLMPSFLFGHKWSSTPRGRDT